MLLGVYIVNLFKFIVNVSCNWLSYGMVLIIKLRKI